MCRVVAYLGEPIRLDVLLFRSDSSLARQAYDPRSMRYLNLAGSGFAAWDAASPEPGMPLVYRSTLLPSFDRNLLRLAPKLRGECVVAHIRGADYFGTSNPMVETTSLHPFQHEGFRVVLAHNGGLARFAEMKFDLLAHVRPEFAASIEGATDSEWIYALLLSRLATRGPEPAAAEIAAAVEETLAILRAVRTRRGIETASGTNLFVSDGRHIVATRFTFDFGCYDGRPRESDLTYHSLWYTAGSAYGDYGGEWRMGGGLDAADSVLLASEPLTADTSRWVEVPEYSLLTVTREAGRISVATRDLDV
jgi:glutamine amidotransferase